MPTPAELRSMYSSLATEHLRELASRPQDLTQEAVAALSAELASRNEPVADAGASPIASPTASTSLLQGWLTVFQAFVVFVLVTFVASFVFYAGPMSAGATVFLLAIAAVPLTGLWLIARRSSSAPRFWVIALSVTLAFGITSSLYSGTISTYWTLLAALAAWLVYWRKSKRVADTFGVPTGVPIAPSEAEQR